MKTKLALLITLLGALPFAAEAQIFNWSGRYGGNGEDVVVSTYTDASGNTYSTGYYTMDCDFDIGMGEYVISHDTDYEIFVTKTNSDGVFQWAKSVGSISGDNGTAITADHAGNVYVTGVYQETGDFDPGEGTLNLTSTGSLDIFVMKLDPQGNLVWAKSIGGTDYESTTGIGVDNNGNVYLGGYFYFEMDFDPSGAEYLMSPAGSGDGFAVKLDPNGNFVWAKQFGGTEFELATGMKVMPNGDVYLTGNFTGTADFDPSGETFNLTTPADHDGLYLLRLDPDGELVTAMKVAQTDNHLYGMSVDVNDNGTMALTGYFGGNIDFGVAQFTASDFYNGYVVKINPDGTNAWARYLNADLGSQSYDVALSGEEVLVFGFFSGTMQFDGESLGRVEGDNAQQNFLAKFSQDGSFVWAHRFGGSNFIDTATMGMDQTGHIYLSAAFENQVDLNPLPDSEQLAASEAFRDNFLVKIAQAELSLPGEQMHSVALYPNPTTGSVYVNSEDFEGSTYTISDMAGRIVLEGSVASGKIDMASLHAGIYAVTVGTSTHKIVRR